MSRTTTKAITGVTLVQAQTAANYYGQCSAKKDKLTAEMNEKITVIRSKYEPQITDCDAEMAAQHEVLKGYAIEHRSEWDQKSIELANCTIGFRTNPASVGKKRGITWDAVVSLMKDIKILKPFVRIKEEVDKAAILKAQTDEKVMKQLNTIGVTIDQEEQFFVDAKKDKISD